MSFRQFKKPLSSPRVTTGVAILLGILFGLVFMFLIIGRPLHRMSYDLPFYLFRSHQTNDSIYVIGLDDASISKLKQNPDSFDTALHADLIKRLAGAGVRSIVFDVIFAELNTPLAGDQAFSAMAHASSNVIVGANLNLVPSPAGFDKVGVPPRDPIRTNVFGWGVARLDADHDRGVRRLYPGTDRFPSLAWKTAELLRAAVTTNENRLQERWLNYYGPRPFKYLSYYNALMEPLPTGISNTVVIIGRTDFTGFAGSERDEFASPWSLYMNLHWFGAEAHALTIANLWQGDWMVRLPDSVSFLLVLVTGTFCGFAFTRFKPLASAGLALALALLIGGTASWIQLYYGRWFPWMVLTAVQIPIILAWAILLYTVRSYMETEFLRRSLSLYLSPAQVDEILLDPKFLAPGVRRREVSILFTDIADFSKISERMSPEDLAALLNQYYEHAIACIHESGGTVVDLIGDAILAIWNAPIDQPDHSVRAAKAARALIEQLVVFDSASENLPLRTRAGLHSGEVSVGNIGSTTHFDYTVLGENVNLASRLEGLNKHFKTEILATRAIQRTIEKLLPHRRIGAVRLKGLVSAVDVFELLVGQSEAKLQTAEMFARGLHSFQRGRFADALACFQAVVTETPNDGVAAYYVQATKSFLASAPPEGWMGEILINEK